jgi:hypothetical protein
LLSRPVLSEDAAFHWEAFTWLARERPWDSISLGMAGSIRLPGPIPRNTIRSRGEYLGLDGDALDDFVEIVVLIDDDYIRTVAEAEAKAAADMAKKNKSGKGR